MVHNQQESLRSHNKRTLFVFSNCTSIVMSFFGRLFKKLKFDCISCNTDNREGIKYKESGRQRIWSCLQVICDSVVKTAQGKKQDKIIGIKAMINLHVRHNSTDHAYMKLPLIGEFAMWKVGYAKYNLRSHIMICSEKHVK